MHAKPDLHPFLKWMISRSGLVVTVSMKLDRLQKLCDLSPFVTGPSAQTELHAGGVFFCVLYRRELIFHSNDRVDLNYSLLDNWRPLADEAKYLTGSTSGKLRSNSRDYIEIVFPGMTFTGLECENLHGHLSFHVFGEIRSDPAIENLMGADPPDLPKHFNESIVFVSNSI